MSKLNKPSGGTKKGSNERKLILPKKMPKGADFIARINRGSNFYGDLTDDFYITLVRSGSHWILWECGDDQENDTRYTEIRGWCNAKGVEKKDAAAALLSGRLQEGMADSVYDEETSVEKGGLLTEVEVERVLVQVLKPTSVSETGSRGDSVQENDEETRPDKAELQRTAERMIQEGRMPPLSEVLAALAKTAKELE